MDFLLLWVHSFAAATLLPIGSEPTLLYLLEVGQSPLWVLVIATTGNTAGAVVNWLLGRYLLHYQQSPWFPVKEKSLDKAQQLFERRGLWVLLLAWLPIIGDPLTLIGGIMKVNLIPFVVLVGLGKCLRYMVFVLPYWL